MIYLNSGSHSITPKPILEAVHRYQWEYEQNPTLGLFNTWERLWKVQKKLAGFFHARAEDLFLRPNVTEVLNEFVLGLPLPSGAEIAITDLEYGAIANLVRFRCERDGLQNNLIHLPSTSAGLASVTEASLLEAILTQLTPATRMFVCSDVMTGNGLVLPIEKLSAETRKRGIFLIVDGAHGPGALDLDFRKFEKVDFYAGNLHKWMMGPKGTSFGWVNPSQRKHLLPIHAGWTSFETPSIFEKFGEGDRFAASRLMIGCRDFAPFFALEDLIQHWEAEGSEQIRKQIYSLQSELEQHLVEVGLELISPPSGLLRGPLISFELPLPKRNSPFELFYELLYAHGLQVAIPWVQDRAILRVSPHIYNTSSELKQAAEILKKVLFSPGEKS